VQTVELQAQLASARQEVSQLTRNTHDLRARADSLAHVAAAAREKAAVQASLTTRTLRQSQEATAAAHKQVVEATSLQEAQASAANAAHDWASAEKVSAKKLLEEARATAWELEQRLEGAQGRLAPLLAEKESLKYRLIVAEAAGRGERVEEGESTRMGDIDTVLQIPASGPGSRAAAVNASTVDEVGSGGQAIHESVDTPSAIGVAADTSGHGEAGSLGCLEADDAKMELIPAFVGRLASSSWPGHGACRPSIARSWPSITDLGSHCPPAAPDNAYSPAGSASSGGGAQPKDPLHAKYKKNLQVRRQLTFSALMFVDNVCWYGMLLCCSQTALVQNGCNFPG
jgi:hypothetical protein